MLLSFYFHRESPNSPGMVKLMNRALEEASLGVYLLLVECKCAVLEERSMSCAGFEVRLVYGVDVIHSYSIFQIYF